MSGSSASPISRRALSLAVVLLLVVSAYAAVTAPTAIAWAIVLLAAGIGVGAVHQRFVLARSQRETEAARGERQLLLESIEVTPNPVAIYDHTDKLIAWNKSYEALHEGVFETLSKPVYYADLVRAIASKTMSPDEIEAHVAERVADQRRGAGEWKDRTSASGIWYRVTKMRTPNDAVVGIAIDITELKNREAELDAQYQVMSEISQRIADGTGKEAQALNTISSTIGGMVDALRAINAQVQGVRDASAAVSGDATRTGTALDRTAGAMDGIGNATKEMQSIIRLVEDISRQIRMLALNASIEAHKAGEHGAGFNVVASEVKTLAERSAQAAEDVRRLISTSTKQVQDGSTVTAEAVDLLSSTVERIDWMAGQVTETLQRMETQSDSFEQVARNLDAVSQASNSNAAASQELLSRSLGAARPT